MMAWRADKRYSRTADQEVAGKMTKAFNQLRVLVAGDLMTDIYLKGNAGRISPEAPVPVVLVKERESRLGGAGNVICNVTALGASVRCLGWAGSDEHGDWLVKTLKDKGVDTRFLSRLGDRPTIVKTRVTAQNQQLLRYDEEAKKPVPDAFFSDISARLKDILADVNAVILSDYGKGMITARLGQMMIAAAKERGIPVFVDPKGSDYGKYKGATVCTPNFKELCEAAGRIPETEEEILETALELCDRCGFDYLLLTRSEKGMSLIDSREVTKRDFPALAKEVIDVTGAGDTVISMFALAFTAGHTLDECCKLANLAASVVVSRFGAVAATMEDVHAAGERRIGASGKILSPEQAASWAETMRSQGNKIVFTNGCYDLVHAGHISSFRQARSFGDKLIVAVNSDASVRRLKGPSRPIVDQENRLKLLSSIDVIDRLVLFEEDTPEALVRAIRPDVLVKGKDWEGKPVAGGEFVQKNGGQLRFIDMENGLSTTNIIHKIMEGAKQ